MKVAMHQPDFLPYTGFFYKILKADVFDIAVHDQFVKDGYQRRVKFNDRWVNVAIIDRKKIPQKTAIEDVKVDTQKTKENILKAMDIEYGDFPRCKPLQAKLKNYMENLPDIMNLADFNISLIIFVLAFMGVDDKVKLTVTPKPTKPKSFGIIENMKKYFPEYDTYLSGTGGKAYTGNEFEENGLKIEYSKHAPLYNDSIIGTLVRFSDPVRIIMREKSEQN